MLMLLPILLASAHQPEAAEPGTPGEQIWRVAPPSGGDIVEREGPEGPLYSAGAVFTDTKLPIGYPRPTPPGAIEIKTYPSIRQAEFSGDGDGRGSSRNGFMPLFRHISKNNIAMTAPVEMRYSDTDGDAETDQWTMAFLYHTTEDGPLGEDGRVEVIDTEPVTVVSLGVQGGSSRADAASGLERLEAWIAASDDWERAGDTRQLGYNGPYVPASRRWWEIQIPVHRAVADAPASDQAETL